MLLLEKLLRKRHLGLKAPKQRLVSLTCLRLSFIGRARGRARSLLDYIKAPPQKRRAVARKESAETQGVCTTVNHLDQLKHLEQSLEEEDNMTVEDLRLIQSAVRGPRWAMQEVLGEMLQVL